MIRSVIGTLLIATAVALAGAVPASAAVRYAEPLGDGPAATCPESDPCDLDSAVEDASVVDGDEVIVAPGSYAVTFLGVTDAITLHGEAGQARPTINTTHVNGVSVGDAATLRRLSIETSTGGALTVSTNVAATIEQIVAHSSSAGATACNVTGGILRDSVCWATGFNARAVGAILSANGTADITLRNVTAVASDPTISYGVAFDFGPGTIAAAIDAKGVIADGATADVRASGTGGASSTITLDHSNYATEQEVLAGSVTNPGSGTNLTVAPTFVDAANGDFHQQQSSVTVDAGDVDGKSGSADIDGNPRVLDGDDVCPTAADIGADEYVDPTPPDCTPPETTITGDPGGSTNDDTPTFSFTSNEPGSSFECRVDGDDGDFAPCTSSHTTAELADGPHTFHVRATDPSDNTDPTPDTHPFTVDTNGPTTVITSGPANGATISDATPSFGFAASEPGSTFECRVDGGAFGACSDPGGSHTTATLADGSHAFRARATDGLGNTGAATVRTFTVDTTPEPPPPPSGDTDPPETAIESGPKPKSKKREARIGFSSDEDGATFECSLDGKDFVPCTSPFAQKVKRKRHVFEVVATDEAGNVDPTPAEYRWKVKKKR